MVAENKINHIDSLKLYTPKDIEVTLFSKDVPRARHMAFDDQEVLFISQTKECIYCISRFLESVDPSWLKGSTLKTY